MKDYKQKYHIQKWHSEKRNIEWKFTFESWLAWWGDDIVNRGRCKGQLVMARYGDQGPYHPDNVRKATQAENNEEKNILATGKFKHSAESKKKMSYPRSEKTKQKMKDAWARRKQNV